MKMKRILSMALALCLMFGSAAALPEGTFTQSTSISASAEGETSGKCGENVTYTLKDGVLTISGKGKMTDYDGNNPFFTVKSVIIKSGVTSIGDWAFSQCKNLTSVTIPNSVTSIGNNAFSECESLSSISIPSSVTSIGRYAFDYCKSLKSITIPSGVISISEGAFYLCASLTNVTIPSNVTNIGNSAFEGCTSLANITIPKSITSIGAHAFLMTKWLENKMKDDPLVVVNGIVIDGKSCKEKVTIPSNVKTIGDSAFSSNGNITGITIPNSVTSIGDKSFSGCSGLKSITIPDSVTSIGDSAFYDCINLTSVNIPSGITNIGDSAFYNCKSLKSVNIPSSVKKIGSCAFYSCSSLESITIPSSVTIIGAQVFCNCTSLTSVTIPNSVTSIGYAAFGNCSSLKSVTIPDSVTSIGNRAFGYDQKGKIEDFKIFCYKDSAGEKYAKDNEFDYELLGLKHVEAKAATCGEDGNIEYWTYDGKFYSDEKATTEITEEETIVKATGEHTFGEWEQTVAPTCTAKGSETRKCSVCGQEETREVEALGHKFEDKWTVTKEATCTQAGSEERVCTVCGGKEEGGKETREIKATGEHTFGEWETVIAPTCTAKGSETRKCSVCGEEETREVDALGHKFEDKWTVTKEATCTQAGSEERVCTVCGGKEEGGKETREIKAKGHKFDKEWTVVRTASAGKPSLKVRYCVNCKGEEEGGMQEKEGSSVLEKERVYGDNRFKTSLAIADQLKNANNGKAFENIIVASGADFADALSASYLAKVKNAPILLVANKATAVIKETVDYITKNAAKGANVYIVGGESVVPNSMISDLKKLSFKAKRLAGKNRYDTNIEVLKEAGVTNEKILIASGMDYADALSASAVGLPILLVAGKGKSLTPNQEAYLKSLKDVKVEKGAAPLSQAYVIGGAGAVSAGIFKQAKEYFAGVSRVSGSNRYETSVKVAEKFFSKNVPATIAVAYGMNYPDGLCGGPLALAYKCPLILTVNQKPDAAVAYAKSIKAKSVVALGGKQLISVETMNKILGK